MKAILVVLFAGMLGTITPQVDGTNSEYGPCSAKLKVEKDRPAKSADENGASFILYLENTSNNEASFVINAKNVSMACNPGIKNPDNNVDLDVSIVQNGTSHQATNQNEVTLQSRQVLQFRVDVSVPGGTEFNNWSCIEITASPVTCDADPIRTVLSVYVPNPSEG